MPSAEEARIELRGAARATRPGPATRTKRARTRRRPPPIRCRRCGERLSDRASVFAMQDRGPGAVFVNPHGFVHEVLTVREAQNVLVVDPPTTEFTWYPGYAWAIAWCARCRGHVGWSFTAVADSTPPAFFGLRRIAIIEDDPDPPP